MKTPIENSQTVKRNKKGQDQHQ